MSRPRRHAFTRGLVCLHPLVLVVALALLVPTVGGLQYIFTGGLYTSLPLSVLLRVPRDDYLKASYDTTMLKVHPPRRPAVYILGGSAAREAFTKEQDIQAEIATAGGGRTEVRVLASREQTFGESLAIVDNLPPSRQAICVITINHTRFAYDPRRVEAQLAGRHLLLDSPSLRRYIAARYHRGLTTPTIVPGIMDYLSGWVDDHFDVIIDGRLPHLKYILHRYHQGHQWSDGRKRQKLAEWLRDRARAGGDFDQDFRYSLDLLDEMVRLAQAKGFTVVLLELPLNHEIVGHAFDRLQQTYRPAVAQLAERRGAIYLRGFAEKGLVDKDFRDLTHLVESGRAKYQAAFVRAIVPPLRRLEGENGS